MHKYPALVVGVGGVGGIQSNATFTLLYYRPLKFVI